MNDTTSERPIGQSLSGDDVGALQGLPGAAADGSPFLIHTNKSGGRNTKSNAARNYNQDKIAKDATSELREEDAEPVEFEGIDNLPGRLEKYARQTYSAYEFGHWLGKQKGWKRYQPLARRVATCGSHLVFHNYYRKDFVKLAEANNCCTAMLCPFCAGRRAVRHLQNTIPKVKHVLGAEPLLRPYLFTVTIRDEDKLRPMYQRLRALWSKVIERRRETRAGKRASCWGNFDGGVMSFEVKRGSGSGLWHMHGHAVVLGPPGLDPKEYQTAWSELVGYWAQSDLRPLASTERLQLDPGSDETDKAVAKDLMEVFKYALKFNGMTFEDRFQAFRDLSGQRLVRAFGSLYGLKFEDEFLDDLSELNNEPYIKLVYSAICDSSGRKYMLERKQEISSEQCDSIDVCTSGQDVGEWLDTLENEWTKEIDDFYRGLGMVPHNED